MPFKERVAAKNLFVVSSEVHRVFGRTQGQMVADEGENIEGRDVTGVAEEHHARW